MSYSRSGLPGNSCSASLAEPDISAGGKSLNVASLWSPLTARRAPGNVATADACILMMPCPALADVPTASSAGTHVLQITLNLAAPLQEGQFALFGELNLVEMTGALTPPSYSTPVR